MHTKLRLALATNLLLSTTVSLPAAGQTVNIETMADSEPGFGLSLAGTLHLERGNTNETVVGAAAQAQYQTVWSNEDAADDVPAFLRQRILGTTSLVFESAEGEQLDNQRFAHLRWTAMWLRRVGSEVFVQYQFAQFERLDVRLLAGTGARFVLLNRDWITTQVGSAYMLEFEQLTALQGEASPAPTLAHRWTNFLNVAVSLFEDRLTLTNTVYFQPRFDDFSDFRVLEEFSLEIAITDILSFVTALGVAYDSTPPQEVVSTDVALSQSLLLQL